MRRAELCQGALADPHAQVRRRALLALADLIPRGGAEHAQKQRVLSLLADVDLGVRQMAVLCLGEISPPEDPEVLGRLELLLRAGAPEIRYQALLSRCQLSGASAAPDVHRMMEDQDPNVRELAVRLLDESVLTDGPVPKESLDALEKASKDEFAYVRLVSELVLGERGLSGSRVMIGQVVRRDLRAKEPRDEQMAVQLAGRLELRDLLPALRRRAFGVFGYSMDPFRWVALGSLARLGDDKAMQKLVESLRSRRYVDRVLAAQGLGESGRSEARPHLLALCEEQSEPFQIVLTEALEALDRFPQAENASRGT